MKNNEKYRFYRDFAYFHENEILKWNRNKQLKLPSKFFDFEHLFRNHEIWAKTPKNMIFHDFEVFYGF